MTDFKPKEINFNLLLLVLGVAMSFTCYALTSFGFLISLGLGLFFFLFLRMINEMGKTVPMKELMSILLLIQVFVSPLIVYRYFNNKAHFTMYVSEPIYMYYAILASLFFIIGLFIPLPNSKTDYTKLFDKLSEASSSKTINIAFIFIIIGLISTVLASIAPESFYFLLYLFKLLKFIGAFMLLFSKNKLKYLWIGLVFAQFTYEIVSGGVFYDLFVWAFFLYILLEKKLQSSFVRKLLFVFTGFLIVYFIQSIKADYRSEAWDVHNTKDNTEIFLDVIQEKSTKEDVFNNESDLDKFVSRLNTGWIISKVIEHTPKKTPFTNGKTLRNDLESVLLPRFLFPNKATTGGKENQKKFTKFTGRRLTGFTTMRIGALSDAYINFGIEGGIITMFFMGLLFNVILFFIVKLSSYNYFFILWIPFIFAYAIRMSDIQVILNYTVKAVFFVVIINYIFLKRNPLTHNEVH